MASRTHTVYQDKLEVEDVGKGVKVRTDRPHLVSLGGGRLSTGITLHPLAQGKTTIGSGDQQDIKIQSCSVLREHCYIVNQGGVVTIHPVNAAIVKVDSEPVSKATVLTQGCMLCFGQSNYFRFNHPEQAMKLRSALPSNDEIVNSSAALPGSRVIDEVKGQAYIRSEPAANSLKVLIDGSERTEDDPAEESFRNKLQRFERLSSREDSRESSMSPPPRTPHQGSGKFSYLNFIGEKLFTKDTSTTRLSVGDSDCSVLETSAANRANSSTVTSTQDMRSKPLPGNGKPKPRLESKPGSPPGTLINPEYKTLSMISTETSIWGSTSSAGTVRFDDESPSPGCRTPVEDVFNEDSGASQSSKYKKMVEERKLEEAMEKKEQERLEEILLMCAQYEQQIEGELQLASKASEQKIADSQKIAANSKPVNHSSLHRKSDDHFTVMAHVYKEGTPLAKEASVKDWLETTKLPNDDFDLHSCFTLETDLSLADVMTESCHSSVSSNHVNGDRRGRIKTNGSLMHSPTSPPLTTPITHTPKGKVTIEETEFKGSQNQYMDDAHVYDCPADMFCNGSLSVDSDNVSKTYMGLIMDKVPTASVSRTPNASGGALIRAQITTAELSPMNQPARLTNGPEGIVKSPKEDGVTKSSSTVSSKPNTLSLSYKNLSDTTKNTTSNITKGYYDDSRIYDAPAEVMDLPPPVPPHVPPHHQLNDEVKVGGCLMHQKYLHSDTMGSIDNRHLSSDSFSSEHSASSSSGSYKTADLSTPAKAPRSSKGDEEKALLETLRRSRSETSEKLSQIKAQIRELEDRETEAVQQLEVEQALLQREQKIEIDKLQAQLQASDLLKHKKMATMEYTSRSHDQKMAKIEEARGKLQQLEDRRLEIEEQLKVAPDEDKDHLLTLYEESMDALENQKKIFEDLEFQQLELETKFEEDSESVQRDMKVQQDDLVTKIKQAEDNLSQMTKQQTLLMQQTKLELDEMEKQRKFLITEFQREKQKMLTLDQRVKEAQKLINHALPNGTQCQYPEPDAMLMMSPSTTLSRDLISRMKSGELIMEEEKRRLETLKQAATEASMLQWHDRRSPDVNGRRFGTLDSEEENSSLRSSETPSDGDKISYSSGDDPDRFSELQLLLAQARHHIQNADNSELAMERQMRATLEKQLAEEKAKRLELVEKEVKLREKQRNSGLERPLTRYLPVRENEFDLRSHVESSGHHLGACPFVEVTSSMCKGYLLKMGTKVKTWNKRWFVFDREKKVLLYYMDKLESKPRGGIHFQTIEDVFVDHMRTVKSPNSRMTFCVKTYDKSYYLVAKTPETMSIWIDVIFTGAEGYQEF